MCCGDGPLRGLLVQLCMCLFRWQRIHLITDSKPECVHVVPARYMPDEGCCGLPLLQVTGRELGSRKKKSDGDAAAAAPATNQQPQSSRGQKFRARKSREAAAKAAAQAGKQQPEQNGATERQAASTAAPTATSQAEPLKVPDAPPSKN